MNWVAHTFVHFTVANRKVTEGLGWALKGFRDGRDSCSNWSNHSS